MNKKFQCNLTATPITFEEPPGELAATSDLQTALLNGYAYEVEIRLSPVMELIVLQLSNKQLKPFTIYFYRKSSVASELQRG